MSQTSPVFPLSTDDCGFVVDFGASKQPAVDFGRAGQAAAVIHSDMERGFIKAEVVAFDDFIAIAKGQPET